MHDYAALIASTSAGVFIVAGAEGVGRWKRYAAGNFVVEMEKKTMQKKWKSLLFFLTAIMGIVIYHDYLAPAPGYCMSKSTRLSDQELIEIAVQDEINEGQLKVDELDPSAKNFIATHPKCCEVIRKSRATLYETFKENSTGTMETDLSVHFVFEVNEFHPRTKQPFFHKFIGEYVDMDACGKITKKYVMGRRSLEIE